LEIEIARASLSLSVLFLSFTVSSTYALSAAHCKGGRAISKLGIIVGEHDTERGSDSPYTILERISAFVIHAGFNARTNEHDIALVKIATPLTFNKGVQPVCLPFGLQSTSLVSKNVQAVGWWVSYMPFIPMIEP
jgi:hypothetical protein